jgi:hypothetical protein
VLGAVRATLSAWLALAASGSMPSPHSPDRIESVDVDGTSLIVRLASGRRLTTPELVGARLSLVLPGSTTPRLLLVDAIERDPLDPDQEIWLYHLLLVDSASGSTRELCGPDARGEHWAFPVRGRWDAEGQRVSQDGYTLTCGDGAQGKCVRFGYKPWKVLETGARLDAYHQACVRAVRADYCGGHGTTRTGMLIDIYDSLGIQKRDPDGDRAGVRFEAAWNASGAVCVAHTRVPENATLATLAAECPRLRQRLGEAACTEQLASPSHEPVLMYTRSR